VRHFKQNQSHGISPGVFWQSQPLTDIAGGNPPLGSLRAAMDGGVAIPSIGQKRPGLLRRYALRNDAGETVGIAAVRGILGKRLYFSEPLR
jgi:hypothetical protein